MLQESETGLYVSLTSFLGFGRNYVEQYFQKTGNAVFLHIFREKIPVSFIFLLTNPTDVVLTFKCVNFIYIVVSRYAICSFLVSEQFLNSLFRKKQNRLMLLANTFSDYFLSIKINVYKKFFLYIFI